MNASPLISKRSYLTLPPLSLSPPPTCSKKEQTQNPNAVINALKTYENSIRFKAKGQQKYFVAESLEDITEAGQESGGDSDQSRTSSMVEAGSSGNDKEPLPDSASVVAPASPAEPPPKLPPKKVR